MVAAAEPSQGGEGSSKVERMVAADLARAREDGGGGGKGRGRAQ